MSRSVLLVVDPDPWVHRAVAGALAGHESHGGFDVVPCTTARGALNACCALEPDCVLAELDLPDLDALWLTASLRAQPSPVSMVPIVVASASDDEVTRIATLKQGVDVFIGKPICAVEIAAQIRALVAMVARLRTVAERPSLLPDASIRRAIIGDLERMNVATVLTALELEHRSGDLRLRAARSNAPKLVLNMASGTLVGGWVGSHALSPLDAVREAFRWQGTRFEWIPSEERRVQSSATGSSSIGSLVLEASRLEELEAISPRRRKSARPPPAASPPPPDASRGPSARSGTRPKVTPRPVVAPGPRLRESVLPSRRPDPRAEPETNWMDDATTLKMRIGNNR